MTSLLAQVQISIPSGFDPGAVANNTMTSAGGYILPAVVLVTVLSILFTITRRLSRSPNSLLHSDSTAYSSSDMSPRQRRQADRFVRREAKRGNKIRKGDIPF